MAEWKNGPMDRSWQISSQNIPNQKARRQMASNNGSSTLTDLQTDMQVVLVW